MLYMGGSNNIRGTVSHCNGINNNNRVNRVRQYDKTIKSKQDAVQVVVIASTRYLPSKQEG